MKALQRTLGTALLLSALGTLAACAVAPEGATAVDAAPTTTSGAGSAQPKGGSVPGKAGGDSGAPRDADGGTTPPPGPTCGASAATLCTIGEHCGAHADCASDACSYDGTCVAARSCTAHFGSDTCGEGETGEPGAKHVSCCDAAPLFGDLKNVKLDKYLITAGRMRTFIERVNGDVRTFVHTLPASQWKPEYDDQLVPSSLAEADVQLGSYFDKKSCHPGDNTGRTFWTPETPGDFSDYTKDQLDEKALNCVSWHLVAAFCAWDGGRMPTADEIRNAFTEGGQYQQPWMWQPGAASYQQYNEFSEPAPQTSIFNHAFGYGYPAPTRRAAGADVAFHISPPGRYPSSWNEHGHEVAGNLLTWNASSPSTFTRNYSWENHGGDDLSDSNWKDFEDTDVHLPNGYYAIGGRCARD